MAKPKGPTSHDVVGRLRRIAHTRQVGHTGTLDPMADGVLVCCIGRATRVSRFLSALNKEYEGEIRLGAASDTYDSEGAIAPVRDPSFVTADALRETFASLTGVQEQKAPPYSAVKVGGRKLYEYARSGEREAPEVFRTVHVHSFDLIEYAAPSALFRAKVGSGTYIRSLADAVGQRLGCGAYLASLTRTRVGGFGLEDCADLDRLEQEPDLFDASLLTIAQALTHLSKAVLAPEASRRLLHGQPFSTDDILECETLPPAGEPILILSSTGESLAVVQRAGDEDRFKPVCVLAV
ncbi:tRNA pseudouridine(55) synthase TruB [Candidatus Sumerlaeota bacterium]|nr:tRNA pseudouridine(55) synthase TruB [Candidatus Sumerlaeota bacterium]